MPVFNRCLPAIACGLAMVARAQTIESYSEAQRVLLESNMAQALAHAAPGGGSASAGLGGRSDAARAAAVSSVLPTDPIPAAPGDGERSRTGAAAPLATQQEIHVNGVYFSRDRAVAEVEIGGRTYNLSGGDDIPGTSWRLRFVGDDRVILERTTAVPKGRSKPAGVLRRTIRLPDVRSIASPESSA